MSRKMYMSAPLPFVGQKRMFAKEYIKVLPQFVDKTVFVNLFGGSGLFPHITKYLRPDATVAYNDLDNYRERLAHIPQTNALLNDLRQMVDGLPKCKPIKKANCVQRSLSVCGMRNRSWATLIL